MTATLTIDSGTLVVEDLPPPWSAIQSVAAGSSGSPGIITRDSPWTIVMVTGTDPRVQLGAGFQLNDRVDVFCSVAGANNATQVSTATDAIIQGTGYIYAVMNPVALRKVSSFEWSIQP